MRVLKEITTPDSRITIFSWNNKYLLKLESGMLEQTYKIPEMELTGEDELERILNPEFLSSVNERFREMQKSLEEALFAL